MIMMIIKTFSTSCCRGCSLGTGSQQEPHLARSSGFLRIHPFVFQQIHGEIFRLTIDGFIIYMFNDDSEISENSRFREFSWELASFFLARPWELIFFFSLSSRNTRLAERYSQFRLETRNWKNDILVFISKNYFNFSRK